MIRAAKSNLMKNCLRYQRSLQYFTYNPNYSYSTDNSKKSFKSSHNPPSIITKVFTIVFTTIFCIALCKEYLKRPKKKRNTKNIPEDSKQNMEIINSALNSGKSVETTISNKLELKSNSLIIENKDETKTSLTQQENGIKLDNSLKPVKKNDISPKIFTKIRGLSSQNKPEKKQIEVKNQNESQENLESNISTQVSDMKSPSTAKEKDKESKNDEEVKHGKNLNKSDLDSKILNNQINNPPIENNLNSSPTLPSESKPSSIADNFNAKVENENLQKNSGVQYVNTEMNSQTRSNNLNLNIISTEEKENNVSNKENESNQLNQTDKEGNIEMKQNQNITNQEAFKTNEVIKNQEDIALNKFSENHLDSGPSKKSINEENKILPSDATNIISNDPDSKLAENKEQKGALTDDSLNSQNQFDNTKIKEKDSNSGNSDITQNNILADNTNENLKKQIDSSFNLNKENVPLKKEEKETIKEENSQSIGNSIDTIKDSSNLKNTENHKPQESSNLISIKEEIQNNKTNEGLNDVKKSAKGVESSNESSNLEQNNSKDTNKINNESNTENKFQESHTSNEENANKNENNSKTNEANDIKTINTFKSENENKIELTGDQPINKEKSDENSNIEKTKESKKEMQDQKKENEEEKEVNELSSVVDLCFTNLSKLLASTMKKQFTITKENLLNPETYHFFSNFEQNDFLNSIPTSVSPRLTYDDIILPEHQELIDLYIQYQKELGQTIKEVLNTNIPKLKEAKTHNDKILVVYSMTDTLANLYAQYLTRINDVNIRAKEAQDFIEELKMTKLANIYIQNRSNELNRNSTQFHSSISEFIKKFRSNSEGMPYIDHILKVNEFIHLLMQSLDSKSYLEEHKEKFKNYETYNSYFSAINKCLNMGLGQKMTIPTIEEISQEFHSSFYAAKLAAIVPQSSNLFQFCFSNLLFGFIYKLNNKSMLGKYGLDNQSEESLKNINLLISANNYLKNNNFEKFMDALLELKGEPFKVLKNCIDKGLKRRLVSLSMKALNEHANLIHASLNIN